MSCGGTLPGKRKRRLIVAIGLVQSIRKASLFFIVRCITYAIAGISNANVVS